MKIYKSASVKWLAVFVLLSILSMAVGISLIAIDRSTLSVQLFLIVSSGLMSILLLCYLAENSRKPVIYEDKYLFPRGTEINGKIVFKTAIIKANEIRSIESKFYKGDNIFSKNCFLHTIKLKDGTKITITLYHYGKAAENEILEKTEKLYIKTTAQSIDCAVILWQLINYHS